MATKSVSSVSEPSPSANARRLRAATREPARRFRSPPRSSRNSRPARASRTQSTRYPLDGKGRPLLGAGGRFLFAETCLFCNRQQLAGRAISSAVERLVYTENVGGSIPSSSTQPPFQDQRRLRQALSLGGFTALLPFGIRRESCTELRDDGAPG